MRLIDVDKIEIDEECTFSGKGIKAFLDAIPTAYDVDKVVEQLEEKRENHRKDAHAQMYKYKNEDWAQYLDGMQCGIRDSIEIVKSGGID